ncbi:hypothetical protein [Microvirga yunnanensis]|uniref:hypothetical protein n=1 Tax=Microvirga yunnanensis TaxID=2953740 RepID=UPI0021C8F643|nr:hypothetical protein [Microvirga sp. HBU65207]
MTAQPANVSGLDFTRFPHGKREIAYHEAGHIVAGLGIGCRVREARIVGDWITRWSHAPDLPLHQRCGLFLGGWVAECILLNDNTPDDRHWYAAFDRARAGKGGWCDECKVAAAILSKHPEMDTPFLLIQARRYAFMTRMFLGRHWASVERVAHALLSVGTLDHDDCIGLVDEDVLPKESVGSPQTGADIERHSPPIITTPARSHGTGRAGHQGQGTPLGLGSSGKVRL